jgi:hypothetical protein
MSLSKETTVELFELQVRGLIATIHITARVEPDDRSWQMIRGEREVTMRDLGELTMLGDFRFEFRAVVRETQELASREDLL